jgi:hypothetical protein
MAMDLEVRLDDRPGALADLGEALGNAGVNIEGGCGIRSDGSGIIHVLVSDAGGATRSLEGAGIKVEREREVLIVEMEDKPGVLGETSRRLADAGVNIEVFYLATNTRAVFGVDDMQKARKAI